MELAAIALCLLAVATMAARRIRQALMWHYMIGVCWFAQSSRAFLPATPWTHLWWAAHLA